MRLMSVCLASVVAVVAVGCGDRSSSTETVRDRPVGQGVTEPASVVGRVIIGGAMGGSTVPVVRHGEERALVWTYDASTGQLLELPAPTEGWVTDPSIAASSEWVVMSAATCPERPIDDDVGFVCGTEVPDALFVYDQNARTWSTLEIPRAPTAGIGRVVSITGNTATLSYRRSYENSSVTFTTVELGPERLELQPTGDIATALCAADQPPAIAFSDPDFKIARVDTLNGDIRSVELSGVVIPRINASGPAPEPSCLSARDLLLLSEPASDPAVGVDYEIFRLDDVPTRVVSGQGEVFNNLVAGPDWFAVTDDQATTVWDREGRVIREIPRKNDEASPVATNEYLVFVGREGNATTLRVEDVR